jgi:hypothetical protein
VSEYQYYEFQTIERPLNAKEQEEIKQLSSRVKLTPNRAIFLYNYGDFSGQPEDLVAKYFDLMFYIANWGSWQLIFRFPKAIVKADLLRVYEIENSILLQNLHDLAADRGTLPEFSERFNHLKSTYKTRPALMTRWRSIKV